MKGSDISTEISDHILYLVFVVGSLLDYSVHELGRS